RKGAFRELDVMPVAGIRQVVTIVATFALLGVTFGLLWYSEPIAVRCWFAIAVTAAFAALLMLLSRRPLFSTLVAVSLVVLILFCSFEKRGVMNMTLHSYDLFFYVNQATIAFLWEDYRSYVIGAVVSLVAASLAAVLAWRLDAIRLPRLLSSAALAIAV